MVFLDTDVIVAFLRQDPDARECMISLEDRGEEVRISAVSAMELLQGARSHVNCKDKIREVYIFLRRVDVVPLGLEEVDHCSRIIHHLQKKGSMIGLPDIQIAATVLAAADRVITRNIRDFSRVQGLKVDRW
ncbi:MAG: type II toxin-antitoxin system VapC family toxin [Nanoarchaeota archaeon]